MGLRRAMGMGVFAVLLLGGAVAANAVESNGVTATFSPASPNGQNDFYTSPVDITFVGTGGDPCLPPSETYSGPNGTDASVSSTCTPSGGGEPYTATFTFKYDDRAPTVADRANVVRDAGTQSSIDVSYTEPTASDDVDNNPLVTCSPASGSSFQVGRTTVSCTARDNAGNTSAASQFLVIVDGAPTIEVPGNITKEATAPSGASVDYTVTGLDEDENLAPSCSPPSGEMFPVGTRTVTCSVTDSANNTTSESFQVTVQDTTPPDFTTPAPTAREANVPNGFQATAPDEAYTIPTASDVVDGGVLVDCAPGPHAHFPVGSTPVTCTATDQSSNTTQRTFNVTVTDLTPPAFGVAPQDIVVQAKNINTGSPATQSCIQKLLTELTAQDVVDGLRPVTHDAPNWFRLGPTTVTFTTTDTRGNAAQASAVVTVRPGPQGPCTFDGERPRRVRGVKVREGNHSVVLTWQASDDRDFWRYEVYRQRASKPGLGVLVCVTRRPRCVDRNLPNNVLFKYTIFVRDRAGNFSLGSPTLATPHRIVLLRPSDGVVLRPSSSPLFDWVNVRRATYYNFQIFRHVRGELKPVISRWPVRSSFDLPRRWREDRRLRSLTVGNYSWYVWAGFGPPRLGNYGDPMGPNSFKVRRR